MLRDRLSRELPSTEFRFAPGFGALIYDRDKAVDLPPLAPFGDPLNDSALLRPYYPDKHAARAAA